MNEDILVHLLGITVEEQAKLLQEPFILLSAINDPINIGGIISISFLVNFCFFANKTAPDVLHDVLHRELF